MSNVDSRVRTVARQFLTEVFAVLNRRKMLETVRLNLVIANSEIELLNRKCLI